MACVLAPSDGYKPFSVIGTVNFITRIDAASMIWSPAYADEQGSGVPDKALGDLNQRYYNYQRTRHGYGGEFDYQPDDNNKWYARLLRRRLHRVEERAKKLYLEFAGAPIANPANPNGLIDDAAYKKESTLEKEMIDSRVAMLGGKNNFGSWRMDYNVALSIGSYNKPFDYGTTFNNKSPNPANPDGSNQSIVAYDNVSNPNYPTYSILQGQDPANPNGYTLKDFSNGNRTRSRSGIQRGRQRHHTDRILHTE